MGVAVKSPGRIAREEREKMLRLKHKLDNRITTVRFGKESLDAGDYTGAIRRFTDYFNTLAELKKRDDYFELRVSDFDPKKDMTELLMISHIFFEMARIYDAIPKFQSEFKKCLDQFVRFSVNQPYQVLNSELIRKSIKKSRFKNMDDFRSAYQQIFIQSKKCYIVTYCFDTNHQITHEYRLFKTWLLKFQIGFFLVRFYYLLSSNLIQRWENSFILKSLGNYLFKPLLILFSKTLLRPIIERCKSSQKS